MFRHLAQHRNPVSGGAYHLPFRAADLTEPGFNAGSSGHKGGAQRGSRTIPARTNQWDPAENSWRSRKPGTTENTNENQVDWGLPI